MKFGNLNFLEPSGPLQACNETALPFTISVIKPRAMRTAQSLTPTGEKRNEHSNIPLCYIKREKFYDDLRNSDFLKKYFATRG